jgi:hypothetical protein
MYGVVNEESVPESKNISISKAKTAVPEDDRSSAGLVGAVVGAALLIIAQNPSPPLLAGAVYEKDNSKADREPRVRNGPYEYTPLSLVPPLVNLYSSAPTNAAVPSNVGVRVVGYPGEVNVTDEHWVARHGKRDCWIGTHI